MNNKFVGCIQSASVFLIGLGAFYLTLTLPQFRQFGLTFRYDFSFTILLFLAIILVPAFLPGKIGKPLQFIFFLMVWALPLAGLWGSANSEPGIIGGLIPTSDASGYFTDAMRLINGGLISSFSGKRPIFSLVLAALLYISGFRIQWVQAVFVLINSVSAYFCMKEVERLTGKIPAALTALVLFIFYRRFSGLLLTEQIGFTLGMLGLLLLVRAGFEKKWPLYLAGLSMVSIGLIARAGAFFVLPGLVIWGWILFGGYKLKTRILITGSAILLILFCFGINTGFDKLFASDESAPFSNFSYSFYGLAQGGAGWTQIFDDHPEVLSMNNVDQTNAIYRLGLISIQTHPQLFLEGIGRAYQMFFDIQDKTCLYCFFSSGDVVIFGSKEGSGGGMNLVAKIILYLLALGGVVYMAINRKRPVFSVVLLSLGGILLSVPFVPPGDADRMRVYAVSIPVLALIPAIGLEWALSLIKSKVLHPDFQDEIPDGYPYGWSAFLVLTVFIAPAFMIKLIAQTPIINKPACSSGAESVLFNYQKGLSINVLPDQNYRGNTYPNIALAQFIRSTHNYDDMVVTKEFSQINPPVSFIKTEDLISKSELLVVVNQKLLPAENTFMTACGHWTKTASIRGYGIFYADTTARVTP